MGPQQEGCSGGGRTELKNELKDLGMDKTKNRTMLDRVWIKKGMSDKVYHRVSSRRVKHPYRYSSIDV